MQDKKQHLELDMEQWTGSKLAKEYVKAVYCHPAYLTYMQRTSCEMLGLTKLESRLPREMIINNLRYADDTTLVAESEEEVKSLQISESTSGKGENLHIIHTGTKFLFICEPVKLENTLSAPRI